MSIENYKGYEIECDAKYAGTNVGKVFFGNEITVSKKDAQNVVMAQWQGIKSTTDARNLVDEIVSKETQGIEVTTSKFGRKVEL